MKSKSSPDVLDGFRTMIAAFTVYGHTVRHFVMDDEKIFNAMRRPLQEMSIHATVTPAGLHNKRCERYWQTHLQRTRSIRADLPYEMPVYLNSHLAQWVVYTSNSVPNRHTASTTPFELFTGKKPFIPLYKFGQPGIFYSPRPDSDQKGEWGIFVGHRDDQANSLIAYMPHRKEFYSRRKFSPVDTYPAEWGLTARIRVKPVTYHRSIKKEEDPQYLLQKSLIMTPKLPTHAPQPLSALPTPPPPPDPSNYSSTPNDFLLLPTSPTTVSSPLIPSPLPVSPQSYSSKGGSINPPTSSPPILSPPPTSFSPAAVSPPLPVVSPLVSASQPTIDVSPSSPAVNHKGDVTPVSPLPEQPIKKQRAKKTPSAVPSAVPPVVESGTKTSRYGRVLKPNSFIKTNRVSLLQAEKDPSKKAMTYEAVVKELNGLFATDSLIPIKYETVTEQEWRHNVIDGHMFIDDQYLSTGEFKQRKARLVMNGDQQDPSMVGRTTAPTINQISVNLLLSMAAANPECSFETADVVQAFLRTPMNNANGRTIVRIRKGRLVDYLFNVNPKLKTSFLTPNGDLLFELGTYVYGLRAAAAEFHIMLDKILKELGFIPTKADPCLYFKRHKKYGLHALGTHVDDVLSVAPNQKLQDQFMESFGKKLAIKRHQGKQASYTGLTITRMADGGIRVTQDHFVQEILKKFPPSGKMVDTPAGADLLSETSEKSKISLSDKDSKLYISIIMSIMYLARLTRPDILFATTYLATKCADPTESDLIKAKRVVKYIASTPDVGIHYPPNCSMTLRVHADASHHIHPDGYGHTGIVIMLGNSFLHARSVKQKLQTLSSTESELIALQEASTYVVWLRHLLSELGFDMNKPTVVTQDNQSATWIAERGGNFKRTKHLVGRLNFLKERIDNAEIEIKYCPTEDMPADFLTKALPRQALQRHMRTLGITSSRK
jgi:hypothetical protein